MNIFSHDKLQGGGYVYHIAHHYINCPSKKAWEFMMTTENWKEWKGENLKEIKPGGKKGNSYLGEW